MKKILVLGGGMVGSVMAADLSKKYNVTVFDLSDTKVNPLLEVYNFVFQKENIKELIESELFESRIQGFDLIVGAIPGFLGFEVMKAVLKAKKPMVDISFYAENPFDLNQIAKENSTFAIMDIGVAPGMSNILLAYHSKSMDIQNFECYVGGLPLERKLPFQYKAPFSPIDVIEEYTRPARLKVGGQIVTKPAMSEIEQIDFEEIGTLEAFNTDGLRSLLYTFPNIPNMKEKTLRYPGHIEFILHLQKCGFLNTTPIQIDGVEIKPITFSSKLLMSEWQLSDKDDEFTVMKIIIEGTEKSTKQWKRYAYSLHHLKDFLTGFSSMATSTGFTATATVDYFLSNNLEKTDKYRGVFPPELITEENFVDFLFNYLALRGVEYEVVEETI